MEKTIRIWVLVAVIAILIAGYALVPKLASAEPKAAVPMRPCRAKNFHIEVETNKDVYHNRDVIRLAVNLLNNSPQAVSVGLCPVEAEPIEVDEGEVEDVFEGILDKLDVDVAIIPHRSRIIGYATLTRLGPSPVPYLVPYAEETPDVKPVPKKIRLPLFKSSRIPGHSASIISTANILLACPSIAAEAEAILLEAESAELDEVEEIEIIPAIARHIVLKPGYYLLDCHIEKICGKKKAQAQKIIQIRQRILKSVQAEPIRVK